MVRIVCEGTSLVVPAVSPYEWESVLEHVALAAKRYGQVHMHVEGEEWVVVGSNADAAAVCAACGMPRGKLTFTNGPRTLCTACGRREARIEKVRRYTSVGTRVRDTVKLRKQSSSWVQASRLKRTWF